MAPKRYFLFRRMWLARRALRDAVPGTRVTDVAMRCGFWEFGRFAAYYKSLFGETPSATLRSGYAVNDRDRKGRRPPAIPPQAEGRRPTAA
jgi:AraC-like DNA-binding protein